jgi:hypothetical protein
LGVALPLGVALGVAAARLARPRFLGAVSSIVAGSSSSFPFSSSALSLSLAAPFSSSSRRTTEASTISRDSRRTSAADGPDSRGPSSSLPLPKRSVPICGIRTSCALTKHGWRQYSWRAAGWGQSSAGLIEDSMRGREDQKQDGKGKAHLLTRLHQ